MVTISSAVKFNEILWFYLTFGLSLKTNMLFKGISEGNKKALTFR